MINDSYSCFKIIHHPDKLKELKDGIQTVPLELHIVPTNRCNHSCCWCSYRAEGGMSTEKFDAREELTRDKLFETLKDAKSMGVKAISHTGGGEPLLHPNIIDVLDYSIDNFDTSLITNGVLIDEGACSLLKNLSWCRVSLDAATPKTYGIVRHVGEQQIFRAIKAIELLSKHSEGCVVGVGFVASKVNYHEIYSATRLAKTIGAHNIRLSIAYGETYSPELLTNICGLAEEAMGLQDDTFTVFNTIKDKAPGIEECVQNYDTCYIKDVQCYIGADANVYTCCTQAYTLAGLVGSIKVQSFEDLWNSDSKHKFYQGHTPRVDCRVPCQYKQRNEIIEYCLKDDPKHVNFI